MADDRNGLTDPRLGKRIIAATRLRRNELRVERAIKAALSVHKQHAIDALRQQHVTAASPPDAFNMASWDTSVDKAVKPVIDNVVNDLAGSTFKALDLPPETARQLLGEMDLGSRSDTFTGQVRSVGSDVSNRLSDELSVGIAKGESIDELTDRIDGVFDIGDNLAERIARTETHGIAESASHDSASAVANAGYEVLKSWIATGDDRTRETHSQAEADYEDGIPIDETFLVGASELMYPGDPEGDDEEVINCRCSLVYAMPDDAGSGSGDSGDVGATGE